MKFVHKTFSISSAFFLFFSGVAFANDTDKQAVAEKTHQRLQDLCTLNIYMQGQFHQAKTFGWTVVHNLMPKNFHGDEFAARGARFAEVLMGERYVKGLATVLDKAASTNSVSVSNSHLCDADQVVSPRLLQVNIDNPTWEKVFPQIQEEFKKIRLSHVKEDSSDAISSFFKKAAASQQSFYYKLSLAGPEMMNAHLGQGALLDSLNLDEELKALHAITDRVENPFYWEGIYFLGCAFPNTLNVFRLYTKPLPQVQNLFKQAIEHIKDGSFQQWWKDTYGH